MKISEDQKQVTLDLTDFYVTGIAKIAPWMGPDGFIGMKPFHVNSYITQNLLPKMNDNGYGAQHILGAVFYVYRNFEGYHVPEDTIVHCLKEEDMDQVEEMLNNGGLEL